MLAAHLQRRLDCGPSRCDSSLLPSWRSALDRSINITELHWKVTLCMERSTLAGEDSEELAYIKPTQRKRQEELAKVMSHANRKRISTLEILQRLHWPKTLWTAKDRRREEIAKVRSLAHRKRISALDIRCKTHDVLHKTALESDSMLGHKQWHRPRHRQTARGFQHRNVAQLVEASSPQGPAGGQLR